MKYRPSSAFCVTYSEELARFGNRGLGGAVHGDDQLVGVASQSDAPHELLGSRQRFGQRDLDLRAGERLALGDTVQLG